MMIAHFGPSDYLSEITIRFKRHHLRVSGCVACLFGMAFLLGCTSIGHEERSVPKIARTGSQIGEFGFDPDDNELSLALEHLLDRRGLALTLLSTPQVRQQRGDKEYTYDEVQTRYVLRVRSTDLDRCVPEGSRQMHFEISVTDFHTRQRVFLMMDKFGCLDTIIAAFDEWLVNRRGRDEEDQERRPRAPEPSGRLI